MSNYEETNEECKCMTCTLTDEFEQMIKDGVEWNLALGYILNVMSEEITQSDEDLSELMQQTYFDGFTEGIQSGVFKLQENVDELVDDIVEKATKVRNEYGIKDDEDYSDLNEYTDEIEDLTDEQVDDIQSILRKQM